MQPMNWNSNCLDHHARANLSPAALGEIDAQPGLGAGIQETCSPRQVLFHKKFTGAS
jgi:hypothetical protein